MKTDKELIDYFVKTRNIKKTTKRGYEVYIKEYRDYFSMSMVELLQEAEDEEERGIRWKHRTLKKRLLDYRAYIYNKHAVTTAKNRFVKILAFYRHFDIEIHQLPAYNLRNTEVQKPLIFEDLLTKDIIRDALDICKPVMKPTILFMASSGCARTETRNLTIQDYIEATQDYHQGGTIYQVIDSLMNYDNVVPTFNILRVKTNKYYTTFCTPETVKAINNYLLSRPEELTPDKQLFKLGESYFAHQFININNQLHLGKVGKHNRFRSHNLRKYNASILMNDGMSRELVNDLQGRAKPKTEQSYFANNKETLKEEYIKHIPALTIMNDVQKVTIKSPEYQLLETQNRELQNENQGLKRDVQSLFDRMDQLEKGVTWEDVRKEY